MRTVSRSLMHVLPRGVPGPCRLRPQLEPAWPQVHPRPSRARHRIYALFSEGIFDSKSVQEELQSMDVLANIVPSGLALFPLMNIEGKRSTLEQLEGLGERFEKIYNRLRLSEDPQAKACLSGMQAALQEHGATWEGFFKTSAGFFTVLRSMVDLEEQLRLAGKEQEAEMVSDAQAAWLMGRYEEWEEERLRGLAAGESSQQPAADGQQGGF